MARFHLFYFLAFMSAFTSNAQKGVKLDTLANPVIEGGYIEKINTHLGLKFSLSSELHGFKVNADGFAPEILPNSAMVAKVVLNYRSLSFAMVRFLPDLTGNSSEDAEKGNTTSWGMSMNANVGDFINRLSYQQTQGYYIANTADFDSSWQPGDPYFQIPDLHYWGLHGRSSYRWNSRFSFNAFRLQTERQLKSVGTLLPTVSYAYYVVDDRSPLETPSSATQKSRNIELNLGLGYFHTLVYKHFYLTGGFIAGFGSNWTDLTTRSIDDTFESSNRSPTTYYEIIGAVGYNGPRIFAGLEMNIEDTQYTQTGSTVTNDVAFAQYQVFIGTRILAPGFLRRIAF